MNDSSKRPRRPYPGLVASAEVRRSLLIAPLVPPGPVVLAHSHGGSGRLRAPILVEAVTRRSAVQKMSLPARRILRGRRPAFWTQPRLIKETATLATW